MKKTSAGFTLVELIVVIAILGILAGIAVPVYSGYIDKAGEAADMQLLGAVNTAFAAACAGHNIAPAAIENYGASLVAGEDGKTVAGVAITDPDYSALSDVVNSDFGLYYGENNGAQFRNFAVSDIFFEGGVFTGTGNIFAGRWAASNFVNKETALMGALDSLSDAIGKSQTVEMMLQYIDEVETMGAEGTLEEYWDQIVEDVYGWRNDTFSEDYYNDNKDALLELIEEYGSSEDLYWDDYDAYEELQNKLAVLNGGEYTWELMDVYDVLQQNKDIYDVVQVNRNLAAGLSGYKEFISQYDESQQGNASVLYVARETAGMNESAALTKAQGVYALLGSINDSDAVFTPEISAAIASDSSIVSNIGLAYALATGYYNSEYYDPSASGTVTTGDSLMAALNYMKDASHASNFNEYVSSQGQADIAAYISAMNALNENASSISLTGNDAFNNEEVLALLNGLLGN